MAPCSARATQANGTSLSADRAYDINRLAWEHFAIPVAAEFAQNYLARRRGIDLGALQRVSGGCSVAGYAGAG